MDSKLRKYLAVMALGIAGGSIYLLPYIKYYYYDAQIAAMGMSNTQSALLMTMYTIGNVILYIPGGIIADKVSPKKALVISLLGTSVLTFIYAATMDFTIAMMIWAGLSVTTAFVFWSSLMKAVRIIGTEEEQGFMYGMYYACNGVAGTITAAISLVAYESSGDMVAGFIRAVVVCGVITTVAAGLLMVFMKESKDDLANDNEPKFVIKDVGPLLKNPLVWIVSLTILCGYGVFSSTSYFTPYLTEVVGISVTSSGIIAIIRNYLLLLLAPLGGLLADKVFKSTCKWLATGFTVISALYIIVMFLPDTLSPTAASLYTLIPGVFAMMTYGVIFSTVSEAGFPRKVTGTVIGIASIIGYLPDSIYTLIFGNWMDAYGADSYNYIFTFLAVSGIVGAVLAMYIYKASKKSKVEIEE